MARLSFLIAVVLGALSFTAYTAQQTNIPVDGYNWATKFCSSSRLFCQDPKISGIGAIAFAVLGMTLTAFSFRDD
jgi:hypothetical protein